MSENETLNFLFKNKYGKLIEFFLYNTDQYYVNELLEKIDISPKVLCDSLKDLEQAHILNSEKKANAIYYSLNQKNKFVGGLKKMVKKTSYKDAGVDIDKANEAVEKMKKHVKSTFTKGVLSDVGSFGGMYELDNDTVLTASTDGVGTKLKIAYKTGKHDTIGQDLVNHCVNDILVQGATPLFFLDYIGTGKVNPDNMEQIVKGLSKACKENNCALIGGETAEMPGVYNGEEYDLASCIVGKVKKNNIITGKTIKPGDVVIGLESNGLHTNGYSLVIKVLLDNAKLSLNQKPKELDRPLGEELLRVHQSYLQPVKDLLEKTTIKGMAHITGGGLVENIPRILPKDCDVHVHKESWNVPGIFQLIQKTGDIEEHEMFRVFNMGIGFVIIVSQKDQEHIMNVMHKHNIKSHPIGHVTKGTQQVVFT